MILNLQEVVDSDVSILEKYFSDFYHRHHFNELGKGIEGGEHYKLLKYISSKFTNKILLDIGTRDGISALAMGLNKQNNIITYDINSVTLPYTEEYSNIIFKQLDINKELDEVLLSASFMCLDIDPHDGVQENVFLNKLKSINYKGIILVDDISPEFFPAMTTWWNSIDITKWNLSFTKFGHGSGTGILDFTGELEIVGFDG